MNFQTVRNNKGQMDGDFPAKTEMIGTFTEIGPAKLSGNNKPCCKCKITDDTNEAHNVTLYGDAPPANLLGGQGLFNLSAYDGNYQGKPYTGYSGFWERVLTRPQRPQTPPQGIKPPPGIDVQSQIIEMAQRFLMAVETLVYPSSTARPTQPSGKNPDYVGDEPAPSDDDIPY